MKKKMKKLEPVIRTQEDLNAFIEKEKDSYYIAIYGDIATFSGKYILSKLESDERLETIASSQSTMFKDVKEQKDYPMMKDVLDTCIRTYRIPYRVQ